MGGYIGYHAAVLWFGKVCLGVAVPVEARDCARSSRPRCRLGTFFVLRTGQEQAGRISGGLLAHLRAHKLPQAELWPARERNMTRWCAQSAPQWDTQAHADVERPRFLPCVPRLPENEPRHVQAVRWPAHPGPGRAESGKILLRSRGGRRGCTVSCKAEAEAEAESCATQGRDAAPPPKTFCVPRLHVPASQNRQSTLAVFPPAPRFILPRTQEPRTLLRCSTTSPGSGMFGIPDERPPTRREGRGVCSRAPPRRSTLPCCCWPRGARRACQTGIRQRSMSQPMQTR